MLDSDELGPTKSFKELEPTLLSFSLGLESDPKEFEPDPCSPRANALTTEQPAGATMYIFKIYIKSRKMTTKC